jgi:hypothetical protein
MASLLKCDFYVYAHQIFPFFSWRIFYVLFLSGSKIWSAVGALSKNSNRLSRDAPEEY